MTPPTFIYSPFSLDRIVCLSIFKLLLSVTLLRREGLEATIVPNSSAVRFNVIDADRSVTKSGVPSSVIETLALYRRFSC